MADYGLYAGNILSVDLSTGDCKREPLDFGLVQKYIGGWGMNARLAYDLIKPGTDAHSPEMPLVFGSGLLNGTLSPGAPKGFFTTRDKASGTVVTAVGSLLFGTNLKWAGLDHLIIKGAAEKPVYLKIVDDDVKICDAADLWGRDIRDTTAELKRRHGNAASVACIGPAGEKMVPISNVFNDYLGTFGRSFGGNLGSKNLKAIVVRGNRGVQLADRKRFMKTANELAERARKDKLRDSWVNEGIYFVFELWAKAGYFSVKNFQEKFCEKDAFEKFGVEHFKKVRQRVIGCPSCITPDKYLCKLEDPELGPFDIMLTTPIDPAMSFGIRNEVGDFTKAYWLFAECNRLGIDAMTLSALISYATEMYEKGVITDKDTGGIEIKPGFETVKKMIDLVATDKGFGAMIGRGFEELIAAFGHEEAAVHIKGTEPDFDARACLGVEVFGSVTNPRGAHDMPIGGLTVAKGRKPEFFEKVISRVGYVPEDAWDRVFEKDGFNVARLTAHYENWATVANCFGICFRMQNSSLYDVKTAAELYAAGTGIEKSPEAVIKDAERAYNLYKMLNVREGFDRKDDQFPQRWFEPLKVMDQDEDLVLQDYFGRKKLGKMDIEGLLDDYYDEKRWDAKTGVPTKEKLEELDLDV